MMEMKDVPRYVWRAVRDKWEGILADGRWNREIWNRCAMCRWVPTCHGCPLRTDNWCVTYGTISRLHVKYHDCDVEAWLVDVEAFIKEISQYCEDDEDGQA